MVLLHRRVLGTLVSWCPCLKCDNVSGCIQACLTDSSNDRAIEIRMSQVLPPGNISERQSTPSLQVLHVHKLSGSRSNMHRTGGLLTDATQVQNRGSLTVVFSATVIEDGLENLGKGHGTTAGLGPRANQRAGSTFWG
jgi:hypothetical protein